MSSIDKTETVSQPHNDGQLTKMPNKRHITTFSVAKKKILL